MLWNNTYSHLLTQLAQQAELAKACYLFRYEELCNNSSQIIDEIITHCALDSDKFVKTAEQYSQKLSLPDYYQPQFSSAELEQISATCGETALKLGYSI